MSSRIIRGDGQLKKLKIRAPSVEIERKDNATTQEQLHKIEKQAFEQGYREGERIGKQMGERMIETTVKRYERSIQEMGSAHALVVQGMETRTVELALEIARKVIQREISTDPDLVTALATVALRRVQSHQAVNLRVSRHDYSRVREAVANMSSTVTVVEEHSLERGDFMIDTGQTLLDGRILSQVDSLGRAMLEE
jgi:flagellar assembly protein FliH